MSTEWRGDEATARPALPADEPPGLGRRVRRALATLREVERLLAGPSEPVPVCEVVAAALGELVVADTVVISGAATGDEAGLPVASYQSSARAISPRLVNTGLAGARARALPPGEALPLVATDAAGDGLASERRYLRQIGAAHLLVLPLVRQGRWHGRIDVLHARRPALGTVELDLCRQIAGVAADALALARAERTEAEAASTERMLHVSEALRQAQPGSPPELLQMVMSLLPGVLGCERGVAYLWHAERRCFLPTAVSGLTEEQVLFLKQQPMAPREVPLFEQMIYATRPLPLDDARASTMLPPAIAERLGTRALLAVPLRGRRQQVLGALLLDYTREGRRFGPTQVTLAARLAEQVAAMIENASLYEEVSRRSDRLAVLNEIGLDLASLMDLPAIFLALHAKLATVIDASALFCALRGEDGRLALHHLAGAGLETRAGLDPADSALLTEVFEEGQGILLHAGAGALVRDLGMGDAPMAESLVCVPMRSRGQQVVGVLAAYSAFEHAYSQDDLALLSTVASQIAVAIDNADLYARVQAKGELRGHLLDRIMSAHELERKSIVDDIHDESLQAMVSSMYKIDLCLRLAGTQNHQRELEELRNVRSNLATNVDRLRSLIFGIRPSTLDYLGLLPTLDDYLARLEQETGITPAFRSELGARLESGLETLIYRLLQEVLTNVRKHSRARAVTIDLKRVKDGVQVVVQDDGVGFDPDLVLDGRLPQAGIGLAAVRERVQVAGGAFEVTSAPGAGTRVRIVLPMTAARHITGPLDESRVARAAEGL